MQLSDDEETLLRQLAIGIDIQADRLKGAEKALKMAVDLFRIASHAVIRSHGMDPDGIRLGWDGSKVTIAMFPDASEVVA